MAVVLGERQMKVEQETVVKVMDRGEYSKGIILPKDWLEALGQAMTTEVKLKLERDPKNPLNSNIRIIFVPPKK